MSAVSGPAVVVPPLRRNRDFWFLWTGAGLATWANSVTTVTYPLLMIWERDSPAAAGLVASAALLPLLLLQLPAGVFVDRWDRRRTMICCNAVCAVSVASVCVALLSGRLWLPHMALVAFIETSAMIFYRLSEQAAVRNVVHPDHLVAALSQNQARGRAAGLLGQPTGSSLFAVVRWAPFLFTAVVHLVALFNLLLVRKKLQVVRRAVRRRLRTEVAEGVRWVLHQQFLRIAVLLVSVTNILFNGLRLAVAVIVNEHGGSPAVMGVIGVVSGVGGIGGALVGSFVIRRVHPGTVIVGVFAVWTLVMPVMAFTAEPVLLGVLSAALLFGGALINVTAGVYQVQITPDEMQGRVGSVANLLSSGANSVGPLAAGALLSVFGGPRTVLWLSAVMVLVTIVAVASPPVRQARLDRRETSGPDSVAEAA
ncbi:MFS transporter [Frankia sp. AgPm24]|uniref:MFS transporter n=1 Tax=Frankia sp. AgPm24 TaxID=631128 RepID=UPI00200F752A|nr:MFS transporter [Frankia sp. AgPm24]MCK9922449.1 MFS transporter [Frankia sp. AgPm24]